MKILKFILLAGFISLQTFFCALIAQTNEFSKYDKSGSYTATTIKNVGPNKKYDIYRPKTLSNDIEKHAIISWGNGTGASPASYSGLLKHLATHGFVVIAAQSGSVGSGKEIAEGANWLLEENNRSGSDYYQKLNPKYVGATGHSQGGAGTIESAKHTDNITSFAPLAPASFSAPFFYSTKHIKGLLFIMVGSSDGLANPRSVKSTSWNSIPKTNTGLYGEISGSGHMNVTRSAGKFKKYITAWFDATINKNPEAITMIFDTKNGALHKKPTEFSTLLHQNLNNSVNISTPLKLTKNVVPFANVKNSNLILQIPDGRQFYVSVYNLRGLQVYNSAFSKSCALLFNTFATKGEYITIVKNSTQIILREKMMIMK